jgi:hypothetical protein
MRADNISAILTQFDISKELLNEKIKTCKEILKQEAKSRLMPGLDDKTITSWNALMCSAYAKAYLAFGETKHKDIALASIHFITNALSLPDGKLYRTYKNGQSKIDGFLEDYAFTIEALLNCYLISQHDMYLNKAYALCELSLKLFHNKDSAFLYYTHASSSDLIVRTTETSDNVIPSSNSQMALNLFYLSTYFGKKEWRAKSENMLNLVLEELKNYGAGYSNWGCLALHLCYPFKEVAIVGNNVNEKLHQLYKHGLTNTILAVNAVASDLPLLKNRYSHNQTLIYVCENNTCKIPVESIDEALEQLA